MKKILSICIMVVCCLAWAMPAQAQLIKFGVKGGVNLSKGLKELVTESPKDNSAGFFIGPMAELTIPIVGLGVDAALLFDQRGSGTFKQQALDIPVNLKYTFGLGSLLAIYGAAGPDFYFDMKKDGRTLSRKNAQVGINLGAGIKLVKHLQVGFVYNIPCGKTFEWEDEDANKIVKSKNTTWQIALAYIF